MPFPPAALLTTAEVVTIALILVLAVLVAMIAYQAWQRSRVSPEERERQRRALLVSRGKMGDATVLEIREDLILYSYAVRGVAYTASQDISLLQSLLPSDLTVAVGPVLVRYDAQNPANSIVLAENWSGLRSVGPASSPVRRPKIGALPRKTVP
jgi:hypothetical protein